MNFGTALTADVVPFSESARDLPTERIRIEIRTDTRRVTLDTRIATGNETHLSLESDGSSWLSLEFHSTNKSNAQCNGVQGNGRLNLIA